LLFSQITFLPISQQFSPSSHQPFPSSQQRHSLNLPLFNSHPFPTKPFKFIIPQTSKTPRNNKPSSSPDGRHKLLIPEDALSEKHLDACWAFSLNELIDALHDNIDNEMKYLQNEWSVFGRFPLKVHTKNGREAKIERNEELKFCANKTRLAKKFAFLRLIHKRLNVPHTREKKAQHSKQNYSI
jgi:hypothetical protein